MDTTNLIQQIANELIKQSPPQSNWVYLVTFICLTAIVNFASNYLGAYFQTRGKRFATSTDIKSLQAELANNTRITEATRVEVSSGAWRQQKQWELKQTIYFDLLTCLGEIRALGEFALFTFETDQPVDTSLEMVRRNGTAIYEKICVLRSRGLILIPSNSLSKVEELGKSWHKLSPAEELDIQCGQIIEKTCQLQAEIAKIAYEDLIK